MCGGVGGYLLKYSVLQDAWCKLQWSINIMVMVLIELMSQHTIIIYDHLQSHEVVLIYDCCIWDHMTTTNISINLTCICYYIIPVIKVIVEVHIDPERNSLSYSFILCNLLCWSWLHIHVHLFWTCLSSLGLIGETSKCIIIICLFQGHSFARFSM